MSGSTKSLSAVLLVLLAASPVYAISTWWTNSAGGWFNDNANWNNGAPGAGDNGYIVGDMSPTIKLGEATTTVRQLVVGFGGNGVDTPELIIDDFSGEGKSASPTLNLERDLIVGAGGNTTPDGAGNGRVIQTTGVVNQATSGGGAFYVGTGPLSPANVGVYELRGGEINLNGARAWVGNQEGTTGHFIQTGGVANFMADENTIARFVNGEGRYTISGGTFRARQLDNGGWGSAGGVAGAGNGVFEVIGSNIDEMTITVGSYRQVSNSAYRAVLDNGGVKVLDAMAGESRFEGKWDVGLLGGAVLLTETTHPLIQTTESSSTKEWASLTTTADALWDEDHLTDTVGHTFTVRMSLDPNADVLPGDALSLGETLDEVGLFAARDSGWVNLQNLTGEFEVLLDVDTGAMADLLDYLNTNPGGAASGTSVPGFDVAIRYAAAAGSSEFAWDLSGFDPGASVTNVALVVPEPSSIAMLIAVALGGVWLAVRNRRLTR